MTSGLPIPIYILKQGETVPQETCYLVTRDGVFLHKLNGIVEALVKVEGICFLESVEPRAILHLPKIPAVTMARALVFFRKIHEQLNSEANLMLHYRPDGQKSYRFTCPLQEVNAASVEYAAEERLEGYQLVGTVHSHNRMLAFHSGVDKVDEFYFDGLHITVGYLDQFPKFSISCSAVVNGQRFKLEPEETIAGIAKVETKTGFPTSLFVSEYSWAPNLYELTLPQGKELESVTFPPKWLNRVRKKTYLLAKEEPGNEFQDSGSGGHRLRPAENPAAVSGFPFSGLPPRLG